MHRQLLQRTTSAVTARVAAQQQVRHMGLFTSHHAIMSNPDHLNSDVLAKLQPKKGTLELADGTKFEGYTFGSSSSSAGEVVFNTGMVGYPESLSDPSYRGQIVTMTYPLQGNYGVPAHTRDQWGLLERFESDKVHVRGLLVGDYAWHPSHWASIKSLHCWLAENGVPGLYGVDTRAITKKIRDKKTNILLGRITIDDHVLPFHNPNEVNMIDEVSVKQLTTHGDVNADIHIIALDLGMKESIVRQMTKRGARVTVAPWDYPVHRHLEEYDGLFLSNGPGDPLQPKAAQQHLSELLQMSENTLKPVFGICMGHQLMARAAGATTYKMKFGHRGHNQPCIDLTTNRCHITSQNHGYVVDYLNSGAAYTREWDPLFVNANDHTNEGVIHKTKPIFSCQFHPEGNGGPEDTTYLFDRFLSEVRKHKLNPYRVVNQSVVDHHGKAVSSKAKAAATAAAAAAAASLGTVLPVLNKAIGSQLNSGTTLASFVTNSVTQTLLHNKATSASSAGVTVSSSNSKIQQASMLPLIVKPVLPKKILVLGSGGLQIGQAGEFDYSGSQAIKALKEEGIICVLINPNIANVQTKKALADVVYFSPVTVEFVSSVIEQEKPDGIFLQFGGQTALNVGIELEALGVLSKHRVTVYGTSVTTIIATEDREIFKQKLKEINEPTATSVSASDVPSAIAAANAVGYPVIVRAAFALGGLGSGFAHNDTELRALCATSFAVSSQVLVERSMLGWKEVEYEVVRDAADNCVTVCNMENFDPLGIHTGDSIVVAPSQTLDDKEYQMLRHSALAIVRHLGIVGECNVQYALSANSRDYCVIEVNPRLSRSSALASKATGYPLAFVAAKLSLGYLMTEVKNKITQSTSTNFEPALDYVVVKMPRWDLAKFHRADRSLGSAMKSVGEVMAIGRTFEETFQKALRMVDSSSQGFDVLNSAKQHTVHGVTDVELKRLLTNATDLRVHAIAQAFHRGWNIQTVHDLTHIDPWYLYKLYDIHLLGLMFQACSYDVSGNSIGYKLMKEGKKRGFSDQQIANHMNKVSTAGSNSSRTKISAMDVRRYRQSHQITPIVKQIDTLAAEYPAQTNYLFTTYNATEHDVEFVDENDSDAVANAAIAVIGSGCYSIGNSVEFDYSCVSTIQELRKQGKRTIMINSNPETVSTDYDESDRLYFEELSFERVLDVLELEHSAGVIVSVGGQVANNMALSLHKQGIPILGTSPLDIDRAEDRKKFSALMDSVNVKQPQWAELTTVEAAYEFAAAAGYPVLVRPSYVLSGAAMKTVWSAEHLALYLSTAQAISADHPVVISKFMQHSKECDLDAVSQNGVMLGHAICEHVEHAGVHSGDATLMFPAQTLTTQQQEAIIDAGHRIAKALNISGVFNCQFIVNDDGVFVIETNVRASRSLPFVSKATDIDFIAIATRVWLQQQQQSIVTPTHNFVAVKVPQFSFRRLPGADPVTGVEMASTGEVACYGSTVEEAFLKALMASNVTLPGRDIMIVTDALQAEGFAASAASLSAMGYKLHTTALVSTVLTAHRIPHIAHPLASDIQELYSSKAVSFVFAFPSADRVESAYEEEQYQLRRGAVNFAIPLINNLNVAKLLVRALATCKTLGNFSADAYLALGSTAATTTSTATVTA